MISNKYDKWQVTTTTKKDIKDVNKKKGKKWNTSEKNCMHEWRWCKNERERKKGEKERDRVRKRKKF